MQCETLWTACISPRTGRAAWAPPRGQAFGAFLQSRRNGAGGPGKTNRFFTINTGLQRLVPENPLPSLPDLRCRLVLACTRQLEPNKHLFRSGLEIRRPQVPAHRPACEVEVPEHLSQRQPTSQTKTRKIGEHRRSVYDLGKTRNRQKSVFSGTNRWKSVLIVKNRFVSPGPPAPLLQLCKNTPKAWPWRRAQAI